MEPAEFNDFVQSELQKWAEIAEKAGIRAQ
jgi:hypothetical protein